MLLWIASLAASCPPPPRVKPVVPDPTPPRVGMDVSGLPTMPGESVAPLVSITAACCDTTRVVSVGTSIAFLASAEDLDAGVKTLSILGDLVRDCIDPSSGIGTHQNPSFTVAQQMSALDAAGTAPVSLLVQGSLDLKSYRCPPGQNESLSGSVHAEAASHGGATSRTKVFRFQASR